MFRKYGGRSYKFTIKRDTPFNKFSKGFSSDSFPGWDYVRGLFNTLRSRFSEHMLIVKVVAGALLAGFIIMLCVDYYNVRQLAEYQANVSTKIYDKNDVLISELFWQKRDIVPFNKIPKDLIHAFIAVEDNDFTATGELIPKE